MTNQPLDKKEFKGYQMYFAQDVKQAMQNLQSRLRKLYFIDNKVLWAEVIMELDKAFQEEIGGGLL